MRTFGLMLVLCSLTLAADTPVAEATILGNWCAGSANAFHEEFSLTVADGEHLFSSWLHARPAESGTWVLSGRTLTIHGRSGSDYVYLIEAANSKRLILREADEDREIYVRTGCRRFEASPKE
jgi:hypothetical protein